MDTSFISLQEISSVYPVEQDLLFQEILRRLNMQRNLILLADRGWGLQDYVNELGFQLTEKYPDIHLCTVDMKPALSATSFLELIATALSHRFPEVTSRMRIDNNSIQTLKLPTLIAQKKKFRVALFIRNSHLLHRYPAEFLRTFRSILRNQKNSIFCLYGNNDQKFRDLLLYPGPLLRLGQMVLLKHDPTNYRSASIRRLFHINGKNIGLTTSVRMSFMVDNHSFYLKLLAWHAFIRTTNTCTLETIESAMKDLVHHFEFQFYRIEESLTSKQMNFLKALTEGNQNLYSGATREAFKLGTTANIARIINSLEKKGIIHTGTGDTDFSDPIFREWIRTRYCSKR